MSNPFSLRKESPKSFFKNASIIVHKDMGRGKAKKFLFDHNAIEALKINDDTLVSFIVSPPHLFLADVTHVDLEKWGIRDNEFNKFNKRVEYIPIEGEKYRFKGFNNASLYNVICEEFELDPEFHNIYSLNYLEGEMLSDYIDKETYQLLERMGIKTLYLLNLQDARKDFEEQSPMARWKSSRGNIPSTSIGEIHKSLKKIKAKPTAADYYNLTNNDPFDFYIKGSDNNE
ncbi:MAG: hypothetical protein ACOC3V_01110 [bacterium]